jgi:hypothetical protein
MREDFNAKAPRRKAAKGMKTAKGDEWALALDIVFWKQSSIRIKIGRCL